MPKSGTLQGFYLGGQSGLVSGSFVFMEKTMSNSTIDHRYRRLVSFLCQFGVATFYGADSFLDHCSRRRALAGVMLPSGLGLSGSLSCLG